MPSFLKSLFKPSPSRRSRPSGPLPPGVDFSPPADHSNLSTDELAALTQMLQDRLGDGRGGSRDSVLQAIRDHPQGGEDTVRQLTAVLQGTRLSRDTMISPNHSDPGSSSGRGSVRGHRARGGRTARGGEQDQWGQAVDACSLALGT